MRTAAVCLTLASIGALVGCSTMKPGQGFDDVQREVRTRTGVETRWDRGTLEDADARAAWRGLLDSELTADAAVQVALLNNRDLTATFEDLDIAQAELVRAGLLRNPIFSGELRFDTAGGGTGVALSITEDFLTLLTMPLRKARSGAAFEAAKARVTRAAVETAYDARVAFYEYQAAEQIRDLRETVEQASAASYELARRLYEAGNTRELDLLSEQSLYERSRLDAETARAQALQSRERVNAALGLWGEDTTWRAAPRLPDLPAEDDMTDAIERRAVAASLELAEARWEIEAAAASARLSRPLAWLEGSEVGATAEREVEGGWSVGPALSIPIPIFDLGGAAAGESAARLRQATGRYYAAAARVRASARAVAAELQSARQRVERHRTVLIPLQERLVQQTQLQYNAMQVSGFQLLQAKRDQIEGGISMIDAALDYWRASAGAIRASGGGDESIAEGVDRGEQRMNTNGSQQGERR